MSDSGGNGRRGIHLPHLPRLPSGTGAARRFLGVPWLFAAAFSAVGFSVYFAIGLVADRGLGLTPLIFLAAGIAFVLNTLTYIEGGAMYRERGGSSTFARHAFNELVSFVAGWAILLDFMLVIALAAISVPHYLTPIWGELRQGAPELIASAIVIALVAGLNIAGFTGRYRQRGLTMIAVGGLLLLVLVIVVGAITSWDVGAITNELDPFTSPTLEDVIYASVIATVAYAGIEAASNLAPDLEFEPADLRHLVIAAAVVVPLVYTGTALISLMAVPVLPGPGGPETELAGRYIEAPVLGTVMSYTPAWVADVMQVAVVVVSPVVLIWAASVAMLGLSRHAYTLARNRQIPSWLGKLSHRWTTPHVAIIGGAVIAFILAAPAKLEFLAGVYAFGATIAFTIAHLAIVRLRITDPDRERPFRIPFNVNWRGRSIPLPAVMMAVLTAFAWVSVVVFHEGARYIGGGWLLFGVVAYVFYRSVVEETSLTKRVTIPEAALYKDAPTLDYANILVPVFGTEHDDDIVSTAGRLAVEAGAEEPRVDVLFVIELPLTIPLDAPPSRAQQALAETAVERAANVGAEYESVLLGTSIARARSVGAGIVAEARNRSVDLIVMGAEPPTRIRGGALLGGIGGARPAEVGPVTEYVLRKAPCRVLLTAPAED